MYDYLELSALYHHGIKGQKWGIIREDDSAKTRLASEKNRLNYDAKVAKLETDSNLELKSIKSNNYTAVILGRQEAREAFARERTLRAESFNERKTKEQKYKMIGTAVVLAALALPRIMKTIPTISSTKTESGKWLSVVPKK